MIILSRQVGESIVIGQPPVQWRVTVCKISGDRVRLGIDSPDRRVASDPSPVSRANSIQLSPDIAVTIVDIRGDKVRLGIEAPPTYSVHRLEIWEAIQGEGGNGGGFRPPTSD